MTKRFISEVANESIKAVGGCGWVVCKCGKRLSLNAADITEYFAHGWPRCCGQTMTWLTPNEAKRQKAMQTQCAPTS